MAVGKPLQLRLFLEGEEVPVIAATVSIGINAPAAASIQIIPLDESLDMKPRTMVHLFFLDNFDVRTSASDAGSRSEEDRLNIPFLDNYKLLFGGEFIGFQFVKAPNSRAVVMQCLDFSSYWDTAHATAIEYGPNGNAFTHQGALRASNTGLFDDIVNTTSDQLVKWIAQQPLTEGLKNVSGLAGGVIRVLEMMGGVPRYHRGINDFFTIAQLRCRVLEQIAAEENDQTAANLLKVQVFDEWIRNGLQNAGQQISFRDMLKLLFGYVHYEVVPNPAAKFDPSFKGTTQPKVVSEELFKSPTAKKAIQDLTSIQSSLRIYIGDDDKVQLAQAALLYRNQLIQVDANLNALQTSNKSLSSSIAQIRSDLSKAINVLESNTAPKDATFIQPVLDAISKTITDIQGSKAKTTTRIGSTSTGSSQRLRSQIIRPDCFFSPPPRCNVLFPEQYAQLSYDRNFLAEVTRSLVLSYNTLVGQDALLADRILAPSVGVDTELLAVKPGKEGYRALMKHELHTGIIPRSEWLPNTSSFSSAKTDSSKDSASKDRTSWARKIALFHFFKYRFGPRTANVGGRFNPYLVAGFPALIILKPFIIPGISQSDTSSDSATIQTILGQSQQSKNTAQAPSQLLGMISSMSHTVDQSGGTTNIGLTHVRKHLGVDDEFLGILLAKTGTTKKRIRVRLRVADVAASAKQSLKAVLLGVTPQVSPTPPSKATMRSLSTKTAQGSKSSISAATGQKVSVPTTTNYQVIQEADSPAVSTPALTAKGHIDKIQRELLIPSPHGKLTAGSQGVFGKIIGVEVTDASVVQLSSVITFIQVSAASTPAEVPITPSDPTQQFSAGATSAAIKKSKTIQGQAYTEVIIYEEIDVPVQVQTPVEEVIRPKWYSQSYANANIGQKIYQPFFGVPSIIDEAGFDGVGSSTASSEPSNDSEGDVEDADANLTTIVQDLSKAENAKASLSIERSVNFISYIYGLVKAKGLDVDDFIRQYANRPIATLPQMLGDPDLDLDVDSQGVATVKTVTTADGQTRTPRIGFHSLAVHPKVVDAGNLAGLLVEPDLQTQRINGTGKSSPIPPEYDVRKEKKDRVRLYIAALGKGPGFRG